jgi:hypothetical protein
MLQSIMFKTPVTKNPKRIDVSEANVWQRISCEPDILHSLLKVLSMVEGMVNMAAASKPVVRGM